MEKKDVKDDLELYLPQHTKLLSHQIAGHVHGEGKMKLGMLKHENGNILKPLFNNDPRAQRELYFYEAAFDIHNSDSIMKELVNFLPIFKGTWKGEINNMPVNYLCLEDVTECFKEPCILDIKVGSRTYDPEASEQKIKREKEKFPAASILGFRILGMRVFLEEDQKYLIVGKSFGKHQTSDTIIEALHLYLNKEEGSVACIILSGFIHRLLDIEKWFHLQRRFAFFSSSLLFVYEGDSSVQQLQLKELNICQHSVSDKKSTCALADTSQNVSGTATNSSNALKCRRYGELNTVIDVNEKNHCKMCGLHQEICSKINKSSKVALFNVHMIDFAHVFPSGEEDENYIFGLKSLISRFQNLQRTLLH